MGNTLDGCCRCPEGEFGKPVPLRYSDSPESMLEVGYIKNTHPPPGPCDAGHARAFLTAEISARQSWNGAGDKTQQPWKRRRDATQAIPSLSSAGKTFQDSPGQTPALSEGASPPTASSVDAGPPAGGGGWVTLPRQGQPPPRPSVSNKGEQTRRSLQYSPPVAGEGGAARIDEGSDSVDSRSKGLRQAGVYNSTIQGLPAAEALHDRHDAGPGGDARSATREASAAGSATAGVCVRGGAVTGSVSESSAAGALVAGSKQRQSQDFSDMIAAAERARCSHFPITLHARALASYTQQSRRAVTSH